jgi:hypothetical protein
MANSIRDVWAKVERRQWNQCWPWLGYVSSGYGRMDVEGIKGVYAHRIAYLAANPGSINLKDDGTKQKCVLHRCDNPLCCNPRHLFLGSHQENMDDKVSKGRQARYSSVASPRAKLSAEDVYWMRIQKRYGATKKALSLLYDVSEATVSGALYGRHYTDV